MCIRDRGQGYITAGLECAEAKVYAGFGCKHLGITRTQVAGGVDFTTTHATHSRLDG